MRPNVLVDGPVLQIEHEEPPLTVPLVQERRPPARNRALWWELLAVFAISLLLSIALFHRAWSWPFSTLIGSAGAVSYTHLDVYKRQSLERSATSRTRRPLPVLTRLPIATSTRT